MTFLPAEKKYVFRNVEPPSIDAGSRGCRQVELVGGSRPRSNYDTFYKALCIIPLAVSYKYIQYVDCSRSSHSQSDIDRWQNIAYLEPIGTNWPIPSNTLILLNNYKFSSPPGPFCYKEV